MYTNSNEPKEKRIDPISKQTILINQIIELKEEYFWELVRIRLNTPFSSDELKERGLADEEREYWTGNYLIEEIFLQIAPIREVIIHGGKKITIYKYYSQAIRLAKWISISKRPVEFVINISNLTERIVTELKLLGPSDSQKVLKLAVGRIFENILGTRYCHGSILRNLTVRLDR